MPVVSGSSVGAVASASAEKPKEGGALFCAAREHVDGGARGVSWITIDLDRVSKGYRGCQTKAGSLLRRWHEDTDINTNTREHGVDVDSPVRTFFSLGCVVCGLRRVNATVHRGKDPPESLHDPHVSERYVRVHREETISLINVQNHERSVSVIVRVPTI